MGMCWPSRNWLEPISASGKTALRRVATGTLDEVLLICLAILWTCFGPAALPAGVHFDQ